MAYAQLPKSNHGDFVYRLLREDEDPHEDLISKNEHATYSVSEHVEMGKLDTQYISASKSLSQVKKMAQTAKKNDPDRDNRIVAIDMKYIKNYYPRIASNAFDFTNENTRLNNLKNDKQYNYAKKMKEVVFEDSIPKEAVSVVDIMPVYFWSDDCNSYRVIYNENSYGDIYNENGYDDYNSYGDIYNENSYDELWNDYYYSHGDIYNENELWNDDDNSYSDIYNENELWNDDDNSYSDIYDENELWNDDDNSYSDIYDENELWNDDDNSYSDIYDENELWNDDDNSYSDIYDENTDEDDLYY